MQGELVERFFDGIEKYSPDLVSWNGSASTSRSPRCVRSPPACRRRATGKRATAIPPSATTTTSAVFLPAVYGSYGTFRPLTRLLPPPLQNAALLLGLPGSWDSQATKGLGRPGSAAPYRHSPILRDRRSQHLSHLPALRDDAWPCFTRERYAEELATGASPYYAPVPEGTAFRRIPRAWPTASSGRKVVSLPVESATVAALTHAGEGVIRDGKTVFVPGALPGENIKSVYPPPPTRRGGARGRLTAPPELRLVVLAVGAGTTEFDVFARQRTGDENSLAVADDALARVGERGDRRGLDGRGDDFTTAQTGGSQARRNSAKCGSLPAPARNRVFTRSNSSA